MAWSEDFKHIPIWLRCTYRSLIDPMVQKTIWVGRGEKKEESENVEEWIGELPEVSERAVEG